MPAIARDVAEQRLLEPAELIRIDAPTLVVVGDRDPFVPVDQAWALKRQLPDARLFVAPDCGHEVPARRPALCNEALVGLLPVDGGRRGQAGEGVAEPVAGRAAADQPAACSSGSAARSSRL